MGIQIMKPKTNLEGTVDFSSFVLRDGKIVERPFLKIVVLAGSPHRKGTSALLADRFVEGARETGHTVERFDAAFEEVNPCLGCEHCRRNDGECVHKDAMLRLNPLLLEADVVVFATPLYYFGMTAQLKRVLDRFFAHNTELQGHAKKAVLLATGADTEMWAFEPLLAHYRANCRYLGWTDAGSVVAPGVYTRQDIERTDYPEQAYRLGRSL